MYGDGCRAPPLSPSVQVIVEEKIPKGTNVSLRSYCSNEDQFDFQPRA